MRTLLRYLLVSVVAVGLAWALFVVRFGERTAFGHVRNAMDGRVGDAWARVKSGLDERLDELNGTTEDERKKKQSARAKAKAIQDKKRLAAAKPAAKPTAPKPAAKASAAKPAAPKPAAPKERDEAQVDKLKQAEALARSMQKAEKKAPPATTKVDERMSAAGKARIDALLDE